MKYITNIRYLIICLLFTSFAYADQELKDQKQKEPELSQQFSKNFRSQSQYEGLITYSPIDMLIPSKLGVTLGYIESTNHVWQLEYLRGKIASPFFFSDIGEITDQRISILRRSFSNSNSFYVSYGISFMDFYTKLGNEYISAATNAAIPEIDILRLQSFGAQISIGNQWYMSKNIVLGIDWVGIYQPLIQLNKKSIFLDNSINSELRDDVDDILQAVSYIPRVTVFKIQLGVAF